MKYKLLCTVTMKRYEVESEFKARNKLSRELNAPLSCILVLMYLDDYNI